ncbi:MarR family transcriptional regulator [Kitasatospora sp. GP82]|uniref:MarR family winged helix-turn-helix transcriptional regulator n=1 Tax=Kitasatospora sp. GP82 TaxID=3035089 RepID=UPI0024759225|nr:MarR family transcriptional regulator [Kitasatospora sp. GP82]
MWQHATTLHAHVEERLAGVLQRQHGLGLSEYRALANLAVAKDSELRMQELADKVGLNQSSVTRLVARLEKAGFTYRDLCPDDKRGVYTVLTDLGRSRHAEAAPTYEQTLSAALDEAQQASEALGSLVAAMRAAFAPTS